MNIGEYSPRRSRGEYSQIECGLAWPVFLSTRLQVITAVKICCETIDLFMHVDISKIFTGI